MNFESLTVSDRLARLGFDHAPRRSGHEGRAIVHRASGLVVHDCLTAFQAHDLCRWLESAQTIALAERLEAMTTRAMRRVWKLERRYRGCLSEFPDLRRHVARHRAFEARLYLVRAILELGVRPIIDAGRARDLYA